ncbi:hypothetical protein [Roseobacter weihaiensis]|uniref:hypothetical protein n=1 Tax=Roseobacter weihaiensis TaxID=2763262 RepID=UPI001D09B3A2|nr:hypothetical protein [Roseobacter sp. H9]
MRHFSPPMTFKTMQVVSDLQSAAATGFAGLATRLSPELKPILRRLIFDQECKMTAEDAEAMHAELMMVASMPDQDHASFMTATIVLLSDRLQGGAGDDDLFWNWDAFQERFREAPSPIRAALMNGFRGAHALELVKLDQPPQGTDLRTYDEDDLLRLLKIIARSMTEDMRDMVCALAEEETQPVHRKALDNCLKSSCILSEFGGWFPCQVVDEVSLDPEHPCYAACTALMILDAIATKDAAGKMARRYEAQADDYNLLPTEQRVPLLAGLRNLHEMDAGWEPYADWPADKRLDKAIVVPFAKP